MIEDVKIYGILRGGHIVYLEYERDGEIVKKRTRGSATEFPTESEALKYAGMLAGIDEMTSWSTIGFDAVWILRANQKRIYVELRILHRRDNSILVHVKSSLPPGGVVYTASTENLLNIVYRLVSEELPKPMRREIKKPEPIDLSQYPEERRLLYRLLFLNIDDHRVFLGKHVIGKYVMLFGRTYPEDILGKIDFTEYKEVLESIVSKYGWRNIEMDVDKILVKSARLSIKPFVRKNRIVLEIQRLKEDTINRMLAS